jgi:hypothetical protein
MPRLRYIEESEKSPRTRELIESAKRTGAPDPRVVSLMTRSQLGIAWVEYWNKLLYQGTLPHKLKEMCRIKISVAHQCRQQRLSDFDSDGQPPAGELMELLCEDHNGTYVLPFPCRWVDGAWRSIRSDHQIDANVIGWRRQ